MKTGLAYLEKQSPMGMGNIAIDTVKIVDGKFEMKGKAGESEIHFIRIDKLNGGIPFILEEGEIGIEVNKDSIFKSKLSGTYNNEEFSKFTEESIKLQKKLKPQNEAFQNQNKELIQQVQATRDTVLTNNHLILYLWHYIRSLIYSLIQYLS